MFQKILAAYDGSESAMTAFNHALDLTRKYQGELHVLSIVRPPNIAEEVETQGSNVRFVAAIGHPPAVKITTYAEENGIDLIVRGHRGKTFFERWLIGSVAKKVMSYASCSVPVVR